MVTLKSMRYFVAAVRHGSISGAASELNIAASAVSAAIDQIETHLQMTLVTRHPSRGIRCTSEGAAMVKKFSGLLEEYDLVMSEGADLKHALTGDLRIGYYAPVAPAFLPRLMPPGNDAAAGITLHLEECDNDAAQAGLLDGTYEVILFVSDAARPQVDYDVLIRAPAYCLLPAEHPLAVQPSVSLADLSGCAIVALNRPAATDYYRRLFDDAGHKPRTVAFANSTEMVRSLVGAGHGCAILNMIPATETSYAGDRLVARPISDNLPDLTLSIGYNRSNPRRAVSLFVDRCRTFFDRDGAGLCVRDGAAPTPFDGH